MAQTAMTVRMDNQQKAHYFLLLSVFIQMQWMSSLCGSAVNELD